MSKNLEIDEQLLASLQSAASAKGLSLEYYVEQALRASLPAAAQGRFSQRVHDFGSHLESPWTVLAEVESDAYAKLYKK